MEDQDQRTLESQSPPAVRFPGVDDRVFHLDGAGVAFAGFRDPDLESALAHAGALPCLPSDPEVDLLVVDSAATDASNLREQLPAGLMQRLQEGSIQVIGKTQLANYFDELQPAVRRLYSRSMVADLLGIPVSTIRSWERRGLIQPVSRISKLPYFDFQEVSAAKQLATLVELGVKPATIEKNLRQMSAWLPGISRPLNQLSILVDGTKILLRQAEGLVEPGGQRRLDFEHASTHEIADDKLEANGNILPFQQPKPAPGDALSLPEHYIDMAEQLEAAGELTDAVEVYRSMQLAFGADADTCLRIGELLFRMGDPAGARERFYVAIELDETLVEARAALGCVLAEQGQTEFAISALEGALGYHPDYADVHFQLARLCQSTGMHAQALRHWRRFIALSPTGPWADEARCQMQFLKAFEGQESAPEA